jgi:hypothetical protein
MSFNVPPGNFLNIALAPPFELDGGSFDPWQKRYDRASEMAINAFRGAAFEKCNESSGKGTDSVNTFFHSSLRNTSAPLGRPLNGRKKIVSFQHVLF